MDDTRNREGLEGMGGGVRVEVGREEEEEEEEDLEEDLEEELLNRERNKKNLLLRGGPVRSLRSVRELTLGPGIG